MLSVELWPDVLKDFSTLNDDPMEVVGLWYMAPECSAWSQAIVHKSPKAFCRYNFQSCKEKEIGSKAAVMHFLHDSVWCCLLCYSFLFPFAFECCNQQLQLFSWAQRWGFPSCNWPRGTSQWLHPATSQGSAVMLFNTGGRERSQ